MKRVSLIVVSLLVAIGLNGCAPNLSTNSYYGADVNRASTVKKGVIVSRRSVNINNNSGAGGVAGTLAGATAGSLIGGSPAANIIGAIGGAVVGGVAGNAIDGSVNRHMGYEYIIKLDNGQTISVVQVNENVFSIHQRVSVIFGHETRIIPA